MHDQRRLEPRRVSISEFETMVGKYRTWDLYGPDDELGAVSAALAAPRRGAVFQLAIPLASTGPLTGKAGRVNPQHVMLRHGGDIMLAGGGPHTVDYTDDVVYMPMRSSSITGTWEGYLGSSAPGLGVSAADYICPRGAVAVASDTAVGEAIPFETADIRLPLHVLLLVNAGIYLGEMWDLESLAEDCAAEGTYDCLLVAPPLPVTGAVGSPVTPIAIR
jgi:hypothetical protein